jgi:hypothetical protein
MEEIVASAKKNLEHLAKQSVRQARYYQNHSEQRKAYAKEYYQKKKQAKKIAEDEPIL